MLAPITSFTSEEVWQYLPEAAGRAESVHLTLFPTREDVLGSGKTAVETGHAPSPAAGTQDFRAEWDALMAVREDVLKSLEQARKDKLIGAPLDAEVLLRAAEPVYSLLRRNEAELRSLFIVSGVKLERTETGNGASGSLQVKVGRAPGTKCERCWNYSVRVGEDPQYPTVCERCAPVLHEMEAAGYLLFAIENRCSSGFNSK